MKKIVFTFIAGVFASIASASTALWGYSGDIYNSESDMANGDAWVLCLGSGTDTSSIFVDDTGAIQFGEGISLASSGSVAGGGLDVPGSDIGASAANYVLVLADTTSQTYVVTPYQNVVPSGAESYMTQDVDFGDPDGWAEISTSTAWQGGGVPEPTSGLLLLVGGSLLALRRKRK